MLISCSSRLESSSLPGVERSFDNAGDGGAAEAERIPSVLSLAPFFAPSPSSARVGAVGVLSGLKVESAASRLAPVCGDTAVPQ